jgi:hypothetical protein
MRALGELIRGTTMTNEKLLICSMAIAAMLASCGGDSAKPKDVMVELRAEKLTPDGRVETQLYGGDSIGSDEFFALEVEVDSPRYVYAFQFRPNGDAAVLFDGSDKPAAANALFRIPGDPGDGLHTDHCPGEERIWVVTSPRPLKEVVPELEEAIHKLGNKDGQTKTEDCSNAPPAVAPSVSAAALVPPPSPSAPVAASASASASPSVPPPSPPPPAVPKQRMAMYEEPLKMRKRSVEVAHLAGKPGTKYAGPPGADGVTVDLFVLQHR